MFDALKIRIATMLRSARSLSRVMRRHLFEVERNEKEFTEKIRPALEIGRQRGDVDELDREVEEAFSRLQRKGTHLLLKDEEQELGIEMKFENMLEDLPKLIYQLARSVQASRLDAAKKRELALLIRECTQLLQKMYGELYTSIHAQYQAVFAEAKGGADVTTGLDANRVGPLVFNLAEASKHIYQLRNDRSAINKDVSAVKGLIDAMEKELFDLERNQRGVDSILEHFGKDEKRLEEDLRVLLEHVTTTAHRFTLIMQVFSTFLFTIWKDETYLQVFLQDVEKEGFPAKDILRLKNEMTRGKDVEKELINSIANAAARIRRPVQAAIEQSSR